MQTTQGQDAMAFQRGAIVTNKANSNARKKILQPKEIVLLLRSRIGHKNI